MTINLTDPANHPANSPLTGERIERVIEALKRSLQYQNGGDMAYVIADAIKGLEELLVSREAEKVLPDEMAASDDMNLYQKSFAQGHNACRAAMLNHQSSNQPSTDADCRAEIKQPSSNSFTNEELEAMAHGDNPQANAYRELLARRNSPVTPDGWQLVPKEPTAEMNKAGWAAINEHDEINPTYRAMLAAAPQQDVRLALEIGMSRYAGAMQKLVDSGD